MGPDDETSKIPGVELTRKHPLTPATRPALLSMLAGRLGYGFQELHAALETELRVNAGHLNARMLSLRYEDHWLNLTRKHPLTPAKSPGPLALAWIIGSPLDPKPRYLGVLVLLTAYAMAIHDGPSIAAKQTRDRILVDDTPGHMRSQRASQRLP